jgi:hypothetical protein
MVYSCPQRMPGKIKAYTCIGRDRDFVIAAGPMILIPIHLLICHHCHRDGHSWILPLRQHRHWDSGRLCLFWVPGTYLSAWPMFRSLAVVPARWGQRGETAAMQYLPICLITQWRLQGDSSYGVPTWVPGMLFNSVVMIIGSFLRGGVSAGRNNGMALMGCLPECPGLLQSCHAGCVVTLSLTCLVGRGWRSCVDVVVVCAPPVCRRGNNGCSPLGLHAGLVTVVDSCAVWSTLSCGVGATYLVSPSRCCACHSLSFSF